MTHLRSLAALAFVCLVAGTAQAKVFELTPVKDRKTLTPFELRDLGGKKFRSSDGQGQVMVLSFWATWCAPCKQELTALHQIKNDKGYKDELLLIGINTDGPETVSQVRSEVKRRAWSHRILHDDVGRVNAKLNPRGSIPYTVFVDAQGRVAYAHIGYQSGDEAKYAELIAQLLAEPRS